MGTENVIQHPAHRFEKGEEAALHYVEAALAAHRESFGEDCELNRKMQWAVTGLLERAIQILNADVYGEN
ncbi:MAG: hypothetical protein NVV60_02030 [Luteimonas sp.]|nr:hypothetical protein [Luteimonas sp.]